ncbi:MAG: septation protein SepH [Actinomycetota bacterium]|nr:septation protein SepH [Actinomycetota bacterium]
MQDLRLIGVHEDGRHLLLSAPDGEHYRLPLDEALRAASRQDRPRLGQVQMEIDGGLRPREVQSMIRSGATTEEVADRAGWTVEKVRKYEGPILAERVHIADQARQVRVRGRSGQAGSGAPTLSGRVAQRMRDRDVDTEAVAWDAWRSPDHGHWTLALAFAAGGRQRRATWTYDPVLRTVDAADDEARWLSADEPANGPLGGAAARVTTVYDVEAEGGVTEGSSTGSGGGSGPTGTRDDEPVDLMTAMRQRTTVGRRSGHRRRSETDRRATPALPLVELPDETVPLEDVPLPGIDESPDLDLLAPQAPEDVVDTTDDSPHEESVDDEPVVEPSGSEVPPLDDPQDDESSGQSAAKKAPPGRKSASRKGGRTPVPSWDDIMFGTKRD